MKIAACILTASLGLGLSLPTEPQLGGVPLQLEAQETEAGWLISCEAHNASLSDLCLRLAELTGQEVFDLNEAPWTPVLVSVDLRERPLNDVLERVLGSVGLRHEMQPGGFRILETNTSGLSAGHLRTRALAHYVAASREYPSHPLSARARLAQAEIELERGNDDNAREHYRQLAKSFPASPLAPLAELRSGDLLADAGFWQDARESYLRVLNRQTAEALHPEAHLGVARCHMELGDPAMCIASLAVLDRSHPSNEHETRGERLLLAAQAHQRLDKSLIALRQLDELQELSVSRELRIEGLRIAALALEQLGELDTAAMAWGVVGREGRPEVQVEAFERAAVLSAELQDHLGVLFVAQEASTIGLGEALEPHRLRGRLELGLDDPAEMNVDAPVDLRLTAAERLIGDERFEPAYELLRTLLELDLEFEQERRLGWAYALSSYHVLGLPHGIAVLRDYRARTTDEWTQRQYDQLAYDLYTRELDHNRALMALGGQY
ncbi:MAG: tetratricopeptide repeat protein [Planctomycetota bacterium]